MGGTWTAASPPIRPGAYFNFVANAQAAIQSGITGRVAVFGTAHWGPENQVVEITSQGQFDALYGSDSTTSLRQGTLDALDGMDSGGATVVLAYRGVGSSGAASTCVLDDGSNVDALVLTAKYKGTRANSFTTTVQAAASGLANAKDLILLESGVELERWSDVADGYNQNFVTAINTTFPSAYITAATTGATSRAVKNATGAAGQYGGFGVVGSGGTVGDSGTTLSTTATTGDVPVAMARMESQVFDVAVWANVVDSTVLALFVAWVKEINSDGKRVFGVLGGDDAAGTGGGTQETFGVATGRSDTYDSPEIVNLGATDLKRLSDGAVFSTAKMAARVAGTLSSIGLKRALTYVRLNGYQVNNPLSKANYTSSIQQGVVVFANDTTTRVRIESGVTSLQTTNTTTRPTAYLKIRNVAISHYIENALNQLVAENYIGQVANSATARNDLVGVFLSFLKRLEEGNVLQQGSTAELDNAYTQTGDAVYIKFGVTYLDAIERIFTTVKIG